MKVYVLVLYVLVCGALVKSKDVTEKKISTPQYWYLPWEIFQGQCVYSRDVIVDYRRATYEFTTRVFQRIANGSGYHFVFSPLSLWISLAAIAEGSEGYARQELFNLLNLPEDVCRRQQYYMIATRREQQGLNITLSRDRLYIIDDKLKLNDHWEYFVCSNRLTGIIRAQLKQNPQRSLQLMRKIFSVHISDLDMSGSSIMMDTLDYQGLWTSAFLGGVIERVPFHNDLGKVIGSVNMMKMKKRVKVAYLPESNLKILELSVGLNGRYSIIFCMSVGKHSIQAAIDMFKSEYIFKIVESLHVSRIPLDIGIPQYTAKSEIDMRKVLEQLGVKSLWTDPYGTRNISTPPALPSGYVQRVTFTLDQPSITPYTDGSESKIGESLQDNTVFDKEIGRDFIADRPFLFGFFDKETYSCLISSSFSIPLV